MNKYTYIHVKYKLELFDRLVMPILNHGSEVLGLHPGKTLDRIDMQFCKRILGGEKGTQRHFPV